MTNNSLLLCDFHFTTIGGRLSLSSYVAAFIEEVSRRGLKYNLHALGTNIEAGIDDISELSRWVIRHLQSQGEQRIFIDVRIATRFDRDQDISEKIKAVTDKMGG